MSKQTKKLIKYLISQSWSKARTVIKSSAIGMDWTQLVDQTNYPIHYLAYQNQIDLIKLMPIELATELVIQPNVEGDTVAHIAAKLQNWDLLEWSVDTNPEVLYERSNLGFVPIYYMVKGFTDPLKKLLTKFKIQDHFLTPEYTLLEYFLLESPMSLVDWMINHVVINNVSANALFYTIISDKKPKDKLHIVEKLINSKVDVNALDHEFLSSVIIAAMTKNLDLVKLLVKSGASLKYYGPEQNHHPMTIAILNQDIPMIKFLANAKIDVNVPDKNLRTSIHHLFGSRSKIPLKIKSELLHRSTDLNAPDQQLNTILHLLLQTDDWTKYRDILPEFRLKIYFKNRQGLAPIDNIPDDQYDEFIDLVYKSYISQLTANKTWKDPIDQKISILLGNNKSITSGFKQYIIKKITNGQSFPLPRIQSPQKIQMIIPPKTNITHFSAYTYNYTCFLYYLLEKYPQIKIPSMAPKQMAGKTMEKFYKEVTDDIQDPNDPDDAIFRSIIRDYLNHSPILVNHVIIWRSPEKYFFSPYVVQGIAETIRKFPDVKFILLKFTIVSDMNFNHANMLIYDVPGKVVERFDPYGTVPFIKGSDIDDLLRAFFHDYFPDVTYVGPAETATGISFQVFSDESNVKNSVDNDPVGFCIAWCVWYVENRIKNPDVEPAVLVRNLTKQINQSEDTFKDYIRDYSNVLDMEKNKILAEGAMPKKILVSPSDTDTCYLSVLKIYEEWIS